MSGFKFSFKIEESDKCEEIQSEDSNATVWLPASQVLPSGDIIEKVDEIFPRAKMYLCGEMDIGHVYPEDGLKYLMDSNDSLNIKNNVISGEYGNSDLVTGQYEGGMKIWECTIDLAEYLSKENIVFKDKTVMDLGCGAGILGIVALINGATVHFQDYNQEVINAITIPNCLLNIKGEERQNINDTCTFFCGDWQSLSELMSNNDTYKYDFILSSETIYNTESYSKFYKFMETHLKKDGVAFIAAKSYYFGVGGGVNQFQEFVQKSDKMRSEICWSSSGGVVRDIIKITFK